MTTTAMTLHIRPFIEAIDKGLYANGEVESFVVSYPYLEFNEAQKQIIRENAIRDIKTKNCFGLTIADECPLGYILLGHEQWFEKYVGYIENIYVSPEARGRGYAKRLMSAAEDFFWSDGITNIQLDVSISNDSAKSLYESIGFRVTRHRMEKEIDR